MSPREDVPSEGVRLQKVLAAAGLGSRRACEVLIDQGRVEVDGRVVRGQGMRVDPQTAVVRVDGQRVPTAAGTVVVAVNKPRGVLSTMSDDRGRPCLGDLVADRAERLFHVGRLDADTEGLILLTNDGDFAHRMAHPSYEVDKTYVAEVVGVVSRATLKTLRDGVTLEDGPVQVSSAKVRSSHVERSLVELTIHEGRNRIVRRLLDHVGHPVRRLTRTQIGPVRLAGLNQGTMRELDEKEIGTLLDAAGL